MLTIFAGIIREKEIVAIFAQAVKIRQGAKIEWKLQASWLINAGAENK